ncbi:PAAR domain-containing protein [Paraburkholderia phymatum]|uniref:PAAR domain-containing protein n=1 Tax=Paraburkholderia phymatum TaxID=148447 RepID=A0ACC6U0N3_9BURK
MRRYYVRSGDSTTAGGEVIEGEMSCTQHGIPMAYAGAKVWCPACKSTGEICNVPLYRPDTMMSKQTALDGDECLCKCRPYPKLIASQDCDWVEFSGGELAAVGLDVIGKPLQFDEQFVVRDRGTGQPLQGIRYRIRTASEKVFGGVTDASGRTGRVTTGLAEQLALELEESA